MLKKLRYYLLLRRSINWPRERLEEYQRRKLNELLEFLKTFSPFYADIDPQRFDSVPEIDKATLMENFERIVTRPLRKEELVEFAIERERQGGLALFRDEYSVGLSSGTSGNKTLTVLSREELAGYGIALFLRKGVYGIPRKRVLFALRTNNPAYMEGGKLGTRLYFVDYTASLDQLVGLIREKDINVIAAPPSLIELLLRRHEQLGGIRWVVSYAEVLDDALKHRVRELLGVPVSQIYQGAEGFIAFTCREGNLHLNEDLLFFEFRPLDERRPKVCNVVVTDLHRRTEPIVRYRMNDIVELAESPCSCGTSFRTVERIHGRKDDVFVLSSEEGVRYLFPDYVRRSINQTSDQIREYQAIQHDPSHIEIRLVLEGVTGEEQERIRRGIISRIEEYVSRIGARMPEISFTDEGPERNPRSGKMIRVVRRFEV